MSKERAAAMGVTALVLGLLAGCGNQQGGDVQDAGTNLSIERPADGASVTSPVSLLMAVGGAETGAPDTGAMHFHVYIDDSSDYEVVTSNPISVAVPEGQHTLRVVLAHPGHGETGTSDSVTVSVAGGAVPSPEETGAGGGGDYGGGGGGYGY